MPKRSGGFARQQRMETSVRRLTSVSRMSTGRVLAQNYGEAARWYRKAAERDHAAAQNFLGAMYASGRGVAQDYIQAAEWYRRAANQGHVEAQNSLDKMGMKDKGMAEAKRKCIAHTLSPGNDSVAAPGVSFYVKIIGPKPVVLAFNDGIITTWDAGKETLFVGDERFDYYVKLAAPGDTTTIEFCE